MKKQTVKTALLSLFGVFAFALTGLVCSVSNAYTSSAESALEETYITHASVSLSEDIKVKYYVNLPDGCIPVRMTYLFNGKERIVESFEETDGTYVFTFDGITPDLICENLSATLTYSDGVETIQAAPRSEFSVATYCRSLLNGYEGKTDAKSNAMRTLLADLFLYADETTKYISEEEVAAEDLPGVSFPELVACRTEFETVEQGDEYFSGEAGSAVWYSVSPNFYSNVRMKFTFYTEERSEGYTVVATKDGAEDVLDVEYVGSTTKKSDGTTVYVYTAMYHKISMLDFGKDIAAVVYSGGEAISNTLTYSIRDYVWKMQADGDMGLLARAVYNYGVSAGVYVGMSEQPAVNAEVALSESVNISELANKTTYTLDLTQMVENAGSLSLTYVAKEGETPVSVENGVLTYTYTEADKTQAGETHTFDITVSYTDNGVEGSISFRYTLSARYERYLTGISVISQPTKTEYCEGESFAAAGMVVNAVYNDGYEVAVDDYTMDKTGALSVSDSMITLTYQGQTATQPITVWTFVETSGNGTYRIEAENTNQKYWIIQAGREGLQIETPSNTTSGGRSVGSLAAGTRLIFKFETTENHNISLLAGIAQSRETYNLNTNVAFRVDGLTLTPDPITFGQGNGVVYTNWKEVSFDSVSLSGGVHTFEIEILNEGCNIDYFDLIVEDYVKTLSSIELTNSADKTIYIQGETFDATGMEITAVYSDGSRAVVNGFTVEDLGELASENTAVRITYDGKEVSQPITVYDVVATFQNAGEYTVEAEILDQSRWNIQAGREGLQVETPSTSHPTSGGRSVGSLTAGSLVVVVFDLGVDATVYPTAILAQVSESYNLDAHVRFTLDGVLLTHEAVVFGGDFETDYYNWKNVAFDSVELSAGRHVFIMQIVGTGCNIDCFRFSVVEAGEATITSIEIETEPTKVDYILNETFDATGMVVVANYSDGNSVELSVGEYTIYTDNFAQGEIRIGYLGNYVVLHVNVDESKCRLATPDNTDNMMFKQNGTLYTEINRIPAGRANTFGTGVDYMRVLIYNSENTLCGTFRVVYPYNNTTEGAILSDDGVIVIGTVGGVGDMFANNRFEDVKTLFKYAMGANYSASETYHVAVQLVGKSEPVDGITYLDSEISVHGTQGWNCGDALIFETLSTPTEDVYYLFRHSDDYYYTEANRAKNDVQGNSMFGSGVDYVLVHIYNESKSESLGTFKIVYPYNGSEGAIMSMDGSVVIETMGGETNMYAHNSSQSMRDLMRAALGTNYVAGNYYVAVQRIAKAEPVNGVVYSDSGISAVGTQAWEL